MTDLSAKLLKKTRGYFSRVNQYEFDNGLRAFINEKHDAPTVGLQCWVGAGSIHEQANLGCGLSHFLEHMLFQGCQGYPGQAVAEAINRLGGNLNAFTSYGHTVYHLELSSAHLETGLDILAKMVSSPEFPAAKFKSEKEVILRERDMGRDRPERMLGEKIWQSVFLSHPVRHPIIGYHELIETVTRDMMVAYYRDRYSPCRSFFTISGAVDASKVAAIIERKLGQWERGNLNEPTLAEEPEQLCPRETSFSFSDPLARLAVACRTPSTTHEDIPALDVLCGILGQCKSSRLIKKLQAEQELAISIGSSIFSPNYAGIMAVMAVTTPDKLPRLETALKNELAALRGGDLDQAEIEREKLQQTVEYIRALRTNSGIAGIIGNTVSSYGSHLMADHYLEILTSVNADDIIRVAAKYFDEKRLSVIRQLPAEEAKKALRRTKKKSDPTPSLEKLNSGLRVISFGGKALPLVDVCMVLPGGAVFETAENSGISRILSNMLLSGSAALSEAELNRQLDDHAIDLSFSAGANSLLVRMNCLRDRLPIACDLLKTIICEPSFGKKELAREKHNALEMLKSRKMSPHGVAEDEAVRLLYGNHPYGMPRGGSEASITAISSESILAFYQQLLFPENCVFGICGDISQADAMRIAAELNAAMPWREVGKKLPGAPKFPTSEHSSTITLPREQALVLYAIPGCDNLGQDKFAFDILQKALNGLSSKLFKKIREDEGLAYSTGVMFSRGFYRGMTAFYAGVAAATAGRALELLRAEKNRIADTGLDQKEFAAARENVLFDCEAVLERPEALLLNAALSEYYGNSFRQPWELPEIFRKLTLRKVNSIYKKYFKSSSGASVIAGPSATPQKAAMEDAQVN